ncbi:MAG: hypothetical protein M1818_001132 [Claussenomyces sp. TS43310]|nr:MAG: hypothetical protein M1818_001132 [Claussenomyces sp. TS43310]
MPILKPATDSPSAPQQLKQPSRKGKKAWRKNVDVSEVQDGLEVARDEVIKGGIIAEKDAADLFIFDTTGDVSISKRHLKTLKPLKADEIIAQRSAVPAVSMRKRPSDKTTDGITDPKRRRTNNISHGELTRLRQMADGRWTQGTIRTTEPTFDPWDEQKNAQGSVEDPRLSFLSKTPKPKAPRTLQRKPISLAASGKAVPAVQTPEGGYSYNPVYTDYEERLVMEGERELAAEQKRLAAAEAQQIRMEASALSGAEAAAAETRTDLSEWDEDSAWEGFQSEAEHVNPKVKRPERKTQAQRNKIKRRREEERKAKMAADVRKQEEQATQVREISDAITARDKGKASVLLQRVDGNSEGDVLEMRRRKLGNIPLPERQLELVLPDELQECLRLLKPEGNLLKDRYRSLLIRGKVESRRPVAFHKQAKRKATEKWTHKDFVLN